MAETVKAVEYYKWEVADTPGEGFGILSSLAQSGVNLLAYSGFPLPGVKAQLDFVPADPEAFRKAAAKAGLTLGERKRAFLIQGKDRAGAVAEIVGKLANEEINIVAAQAICAGEGRWGMLLWVRPADFDRAAQALGA